jgi:hypothetical protein
MKPTQILATTLALFFTPCAFSFAADAAGEAATEVAPNASLDTAIPNGIKLLEAKDYKSFLKAFVPPDVHAKMTAEKGEDAFVARFADGKAEKLLSVLKAIKDKKPTMTDQGKVAVYDLAEEIAGKKTIQFIQIGNAWYIKN